MKTSIRSLCEAFPNRCVAGFHIYGYEDASAVIAAAERAGAPVALLAGPRAVRDLEPRIAGPVLCAMAERAAVPVALHLDHAAAYEDAARGILHGFTSVMFDGRRLSPEDCVEQLQDVAGLARAAGAALEACLPPDGGWGGAGLELLCRRTGCDMLAVDADELARAGLPGWPGRAPLPVSVHARRAYGPGELRRLAAAGARRVDIDRDLDGDVMEPGEEGAPHTRRELYRSISRSVYRRALACLGELA